MGVEIHGRSSFGVDAARELRSALRRGRERIVEEGLEERIRNLRGQLFTRMERVFGEDWPDLDGDALGDEGEKILKLIQRSQRVLSELEKRPEITSRPVGFSPTIPKRGERGSNMS